MKNSKKTPKPGQIGSPEHDAAIAPQGEPTGKTKPVKEKAPNATKAVMELARATAKAKKARDYLDWAEKEVGKAQVHNEIAQAALAEAKGNPLVKDLLS